ncbi:hypothetical protein PG984_000358 [Apiospora sp. TS-2023a]
MEWHNASCRRLDLASEGEIKFCLGCGSYEEPCPQAGGSLAVVAHTSSSSQNDTFKEVPHHLPIHQKSETRILVLHGGKFEGPICADLITVKLPLTLPAEHRYEALSYTWADESGDATPCKTIQLGGRPFLITSNCENALRRLRREYVTRDQGPCLR